MEHNARTERLAAIRAANEAARRERAARQAEHDALMTALCAMPDASLTRMLGAIGGAA